MGGIKGERAAAYISIHKIGQQLHRALFELPPSTGHTWQHHRARHSIFIRKINGTSVWWHVLYRHKASRHHRVAQSSQ